MSDFPKVSESIFDAAKTNTELFLELVGQYFPEAIKDGEVDFTALKEEMGEFAEVTAEHYDFTWAGKQAAKKQAQADAYGRTLRFKPQDSVNADTTENLYIEGDNLEALMLLRRAYYGKIKMIYIDPPYNTGSDFVYRDNFSMTEKELSELSGDETDSERMRKNTTDSARFHTNWLNMMYPRLKIARDLLSDDGLIIVNMDENEITNLQKIMSEIFSAQNDLGTIVWDKRNPKGDAKGVSYQHEYIVLFAKNKSSFLNNCGMLRPKKNAAAMLAKAKQLFNKVSSSYTLDQANEDFAIWLSKQADVSGGEKAYNRIDNNGDLYQAVSMSWPNKKKAPDEYFIPLIHPITQKPCPVPERGWRNPPSTMAELLSKNLIIFGENETTQPRRKYLLKENLYENIPSLLYYGGSDTALLTKLGIPFDTPKVIDICKEHIMSFTKDNDIILDFFSGSATTAHAVMQLNAETNGKRKFIMVQIPEAIDESHDAFKAGFENICEIGKERIRRAAKKIHEENPDAVFDDGFLCFETADTNIRWNKMTDDEILNLDRFAMGDDAIDFVEGFTDTDVVYEIMLRQHGIPLSTPIVKMADISDRTYIFNDAVVVCLESKISKELIEKLAAIEPIPAKFILRDSAFGDDYQLKETAYRRLTTLIGNHQSEEEKRSKYNTYTVEFI